MTTLFVIVAIWLASARFTYIVWKRQWLDEFGKWTAGDRAFVAPFCILVGPFAAGVWVMWGWQPIARKLGYTYDPDKVLETRSKT